MEALALGLTVKSGWAAAVLLVVDSHQSPHVADSRRIELSDPEDPESRQPYHAGFGTARSGGPELTRLVGSVRRFGLRSVTNLIKSYTTVGQRLSGAGVVVGSLNDPARIANDHIRIHALEGQLFRTIVEESVRAHALRCEVWRERDLYAAAAAALHQNEARIRSAVTALGRTTTGPWRAEQKAAATAAWLVLRGSHVPPQS